MHPRFYTVSKKTCMLYADDMKVETKLTSGAKKSNVRNKG